MSQTESTPTADDERVVSNERLTGLLAAILLVLLAAEGVTIAWGVGATRSTHVFIGMLLLPPVVFKVASTGYRASRYYLGDPAFIRRGPPPILLRVAGPVVVATSLAVLGSGIALVAFHPHPSWAKLAHKVTFILWFGAMTLHVLGHARDTPALAAADFQPAQASAGRAARLSAVVASIALGIGLAVWSLSWRLNR